MSEHVTQAEIQSFERRVMSVGHGVLSDSEWRRLIDTLAAETLRADRAEAEQDEWQRVALERREQLASSEVARRTVSAERDGHKAYAIEAEARMQVALEDNAQLRAQVERMQPVVDAAESVRYECSDGFCDVSVSLCSLCHLRAKIDAYRASSTQEAAHE